MTLDTSIHKNIMLQILGFKGGTAAYIFYDLNRFSTDLDFDLTKRLGESEFAD